jgi:hypothetical protein
VEKAFRERLLARAADAEQRGDADAPQRLVGLAGGGALSRGARRHRRSPAADRNRHDVPADESARSDRGRSTRSGQPKARRSAHPDGPA